MLYDCFVIAVTKIKNIGNFGASIGGLVCHVVGRRKFVEFFQNTTKISELFPQNIDIRINAKMSPIF